MYGHADEAELIARSRKGDLAAFNTLVEYYQTAIYNLCFRLLGTREAAEDVTQEAFISCYRFLDRFRGGSFRSWLYRIAANACYDELRRRRSRPALSLDDSSREDERAHDVASPGPTLQEQVERMELAQTLQEALRALPYDQRLAVTLRDVQGMEYAEIAEITGSSLGTVKSRINRGRLRLRSLLLARRELLPERFRQTSEEV